MKNMRVFYNYTEKALKPQIYSQMVRKNLEKKSFQEVMHQLYLYQNNVSIFDYDYYNECSYSLIKEQKSLNLSEIMTVLKLGLQHNIKNEMLWKHFENEFFLRLDNSMGSLIRNQDKLEKKEMEKMFTMLNKNNQDYFQLISQEFIEQHKQNMDQDVQVEQEQVYEKISNKNCSKVLQNLEEFVQLLMWSSSKNYKLFTLVLQSFLHPKYNMQTPQSLIKFAEMLTYTSQMLMQQYQENTKKYLGRSIKKVYSYQNAFFPQLVKHLQEKIKVFEDKELEDLINVLLTFPIKKRVHKREITDILLTQCLERKLDQKYMQKVKQLLGNDKKLQNLFLEKSKMAIAQ